MRNFLGLPGTTACPGWRGKLVTDDFSAYKACFELGVTEAGCMAHARRKFHELWATHQSTIGEQVLKFFAELYEVERGAQDAGARLEARRRRSRPVAGALHPWLIRRRQNVPRRIGHRQNHRLQLEPMGGSDALHWRCRSTDRQQLGREPDPSDRRWTQQLAVRRQPARANEWRRS